MGLKTPSIQSLVEVDRTWVTPALHFSNRERREQDPSLPQTHAAAHKSLPAWSHLITGKLTVEETSVGHAAQPHPFHGTPWLLSAGTHQAGLGHPLLAPGSTPAGFSLLAARWAPTAAGWRTPMHVHCRSLRSSSINPRSWRAALVPGPRGHRQLRATSMGLDAAGVITCGQGC